MQNMTTALRALDQVDQSGEYAKLQFQFDAVDEGVVAHQDEIEVSIIER